MQTKKLVIILIIISVALMCSLFGIGIVFAEKEKSVNTNFTFKYDNRVNIFQVQNANNFSDFSSIDTSIGANVYEPEITPAVANMYFDGWYLDENLTIKVEFPIVSELGKKLYPKYLEGNIPYEKYVYVNSGYYSINGSISDTSLETIVIPDYFDDGVNGVKPVRYIGGSFFANNTNIKTVYIGNNIQSLSNSLFTYCSALEIVHLGNSIKTIGIGAFSNCLNLQQINFPDSLESIGYSAFYNCPSLISINISKNVNLIEQQAFNGCSNLLQIVVDEDNTHFDSRDNCNAIIDSNTNALVVGSVNSTIPEGVTELGEGCFSGRTFETIELPNSLIKINRLAFGECKNLKSIVIPNNVTEIGDNAFSNSSIENIEFSEGLRSIGDSVFYLCKNLTNVILPNSLESIGNFAFQNCYGLISMVIPKNVSNIGDAIFRYCINLTELSVDANNEIYDSRYNCNAIVLTSSNTIVQGLSTTIIHESVVALGDYSFDAAFSTAAKPKSIIIPDNIKFIGKNAFRSCGILTNITFESPANWQRASNLEFTSNVESVDMSDSEQNAKWFRGETIKDEQGNEIQNNQYVSYCWRQI